MQVSYQMLVDGVLTYYPLNATPGSTDYTRFDGTSILHNLLQSKLKDEMTTCRWQEFVSSIGSDRDDILATQFSLPDTFRNSFGGILDLHEERLTNIKFSRSLHFRLSILGPYYTVFGMDTVELVISEHKSVFFDPIICVSPFGLFESFFDLVHDRIKREYDALYVDYGLARQKVRSLKLPGSSMSAVKDQADATIYAAMFDMFDVTQFKSFGDRQR